MWMSGVRFLEYDTTGYGEARLPKANGKCGRETAFPYAMHVGRRHYLLQRHGSDACRGLFEPARLTPISRVGTNFAFVLPYTEVWRLGGGGEPGPAGRRFQRQCEARSRRNGNGGNMTSMTGRECQIPGIYKSYCCSYEVALSASASYPRCPRCAAWATWIASGPMPAAQKIGGASASRPAARRFHTRTIDRRHLFDPS